MPFFKDKKKPFGASKDGNSAAAAPCDYSANSEEQEAVNGENNAEAFAGNFANNGRPEPPQGGKPDFMNGQNNQNGGFAAPNGFANGGNRPQPPQGGKPDFMNGQNNQNGGFAAPNGFANGEMPEFSQEESENAETTPTDFKGRGKRI